MRQLNRKATVRRQDISNADYEKLFLCFLAKSRDFKE